jgi:4-diphosphocytidyl-2-C-methyl-D-erythritol kinase
MLFHRSALGLVVHAPAKLNLFFEVLSKREDGYHDIETLAYPIDLYDTLVFENEAGTEIHFSCAACPATIRFGMHDLPLGSENLVMRALESLRKRTGVRRGATVRLVKRIPSAAGLGGGSSDAAAALFAANEVWQLGLTVSELAQLGASIGSDVPLFVTPGASVCRGRGERVEKVEGLGVLHFVVVRPPVGLSTSEVYRACRAAEQPRRLDSLLPALKTGNLATAGKRMFNRLQEAAKSLCPWIGRLEQELARLDCLGHQMSGSGSSYFGLCHHARHARQAAQRLENRGLGTAFAVRGSW